MYALHACACLSAAFSVLTFASVPCFAPKSIPLIIVALFTLRALYIGYWVIGGGEIPRFGLKLSCGIITYCLGYLTIVGCSSKCDSYVALLSCTQAWKM